MASKAGAVAKGKTSKQDDVKNTKLMQNDLRRMMREKQAASASSKKIDSPLAKYNNLGQLVCVLCNVRIKSELVWTAHINSKGHKENILKLKNIDKGNNNTSSEKSVHSSSQILKRSRTSQDENSPSTKKTKVESKKEENSTAKQRELRVSFSMSDDEEENEEQSTEAKPGLPADFFDSEAKSTTTTVTTTATTTASTASSANSSNNKTGLPEGFFDDPVVDAKARKVEYKDPMDEEWDKFQKVISEASSVSQVMMDENDEDMKTEREIDEIDEQIHNWARVEALQRRKDETRKDTEVTENDAEMEDMSLEDDEIEDLLNWRSKGAWR